MRKPCIKDTVTNVSFFLFFVIIKMKMVVIVSITTKTEVYCNAIPTAIQAMLLVLVLE
jgi:hypothetical protein